MGVPTVSKNGVRQISGGVESRKYERTHGDNMQYLYKEAGVQHVDALTGQSTTIQHAGGV